MNIGLFFILMVLALNSYGMPASLVTPQEVEASANAVAVLRTKYVPDKDSPRIELVEPSLAGPISSPTSIQLSFLASAPATIVLSTFKVLYGAFQIDITDRLLAAAQVSSKGLHVAEATLPSGQHKMHLWIEDSLGRKGYRLIEFQIK